ncbi:MAG: hypothetical protein M3Y22_01140 [Pseudomonadota bacterium]|nr:hypothetical protein [Pseudomonadota bacterium]
MRSLWSETSGIQPTEYSRDARAIAQEESTPGSAHAFGILRIVFGLVWAIDAYFKWQPAFQSGLITYLTGGMEGQPAPVMAWVKFWIDVVRINPHVFAHIVALSETALAIALIVGVLSNTADLGGVLLALVIWSTAEGFGGPYKAGSTDIGASIIYVLVFAALFLSQSGLYFGIDRRLTPMLGRWGWLASAPIGWRGHPLRHVTVTPEKAAL